MDRIVSALRRILSRSFADSMADKVASYRGMMSYLRDQWTLFKLDVMSAGPFERLKGYLQDALDAVNAMSEDERLRTLTTRRFGISLPWTPRGGCRLSEERSISTKSKTWRGKEFLRAAEPLKRSVAPISTADLDNRRSRPPFRSATVVC